jgi:hypothetical protein
MVLGEALGGWLCFLFFGVASRPKLMKKVGSGKKPFKTCAILGVTAPPYENYRYSTLEYRHLFLNIPVLPHNQNFI